MATSDGYGPCPMPRFTSGSLPRSPSRKIAVASAGLIRNHSPQSRHFADAISDHPPRRVPARALRIPSRSATRYVRSGPGIPGLNTADRPLQRLRAVPGARILKLFRVVVAATDNPVPLAAVGALVGFVRGGPIGPQTPQAPQRGQRVRLGARASAHSLPASSSSASASVPWRSAYRSRWLRST